MAAVKKKTIAKGAKMGSGTPAKKANEEAAKKAKAKKKAPHDGLVSSAQEEIGDETGRVEAGVPAQEQATFDDEDDEFSGESEGNGMAGGKKEGEDAGKQGGSEDDEGEESEGAIREGAGTQVAESEDDEGEGADGESGGAGSEEEGEESADDGRMPSQQKDEIPAGAEEVTIANVVSDPERGQKKDGRKGKSKESKGGEESEDAGEDSPEESGKSAIGDVAAAEGGNLQGGFARVQTNLSSLDPERVLEAALFMSGQPISSSELAKLVGIAAIGFVDEKLEGLARKYQSGESAIEVVKEENGKWSMRVRATYAPAVKGFAGEAEISRHALKTLAYISKNEGIKKRDLFNKLGSSIYENVAELLDKGFVTATPAGRTVSLKTTGKFRQYFQG